jgi:antitoxin ParD1/3/4
MPSKYHLNVSVTQHLDHFVAEQVVSGRFASASEVVRAGLRLLERELASHPVAMAKGAPRNDVVPSRPATLGGAGPDDQKETP